MQTEFYGYVELVFHVRATDPSHGGNAVMLNFPWILINRFISPLFTVRTSSWSFMYFHVRFHLTAVTQRGRVIHRLVPVTVQNQRSQTFNSQPKSERNKEQKEKKKNGSDGVRTRDPSDLNRMT